MFSVQWFSYPDWNGCSCRWLNLRNAWTQRFCTWALTKKEQIYVQVFVLNQQCQQQANHCFPLPICSMGLVHLPTFTINVCHSCRNIYQSHGMVWVMLLDWLDHLRLLKITRLRVPRDLHSCRAVSTVKRPVDSSWWSLMKHWFAM